MSYYKIPLTAGVAYRHDVQGTLLLIDDLGVASGVDVTLLYNGSEGVTMPGRKVAFRLVQPYDAVILQSDVDTTVALFLSGADVQLGFTSGLAVTVPNGVVVTNTAAERVPVDVGGGVINVTATDVGINNTSADPVPTLENLPGTITASSVAAADIAAALLAESATRRGFYARNDGPDAVALVPAAGTYADAAIILLAGETWKEDVAPGAAWYCICDAGLTATVKVLEAE